MSSETEPSAAPAGLGRASAMLASGTIVSRILGFIRVVVLAAAIGQASSAAADAFGVANQLPNSIYALVAGGVLSAVLVPQIVRAGLHADGGQLFINRIITFGVVIFLAVTLVATLAAPALISLYAQQSIDGGRGFSPLSDPKILEQGHRTILLSRRSQQHRDIDIAAFAFARGAGIAGRDQHFVDARRLRELPRQRVFASAGSDDEDLVHGLRAPRNGAQCAGIT